ncbi:hypothetical protein CS369_18555 [Candidatus Symbiopectobacterium sp. 'North America']|nr:hypothetical protein [Candidatus Symbiopectobacterium sp. 'North America']
MEGVSLIDNRQVFTNTKIYTPLGEKQDSHTQRIAFDLEEFSFPFTIQDIIRHDDKRWSITNKLSEKLTIIFYMYVLNVFFSNMSETVLQKNESRPKSKTLFITINPPLRIHREI